MHPIPRSRLRCVPLHRCVDLHSALPPALGRQPMSMVRPLEKCEKDKIESYWGSICIISPTIEVQSIDTPALRLLETTFAPSVFPKLSRIVLRLLDDTPASFTITRLLLSANVKHAQFLPSKRLQNGGDVSAALNNIQTHSLIFSLRLGTYGVALSISTVDSAVSAVALSLRNLELWGNFSWHEVWPVVVKAQELEHLAFPSFDDSQALQGVSPTSLPHLKSLMGDPQSIASMVSALDVARRLSKIHIRVLKDATDISLHDLQRCVVSISSRCPEIETLILSVPKIVRQKGDKSSFSLDPLSLCSRMMCFEMEMDPVDYKPTDDTIELLASSWSDLRVFRLGGSRAKPTTTISSVLSISQHCPKAEIIRVPLQTGVTIPTSAAFGHIKNLKELHLGRRVQKVRTIELLHILRQPPSERCQEQVNSTQ